MNLALFDFDGTITRGDSWKPFMRLAAGSGRKLVAYTVLAPVGVGYYAGLVAGRTARPLFARVAFRGVDTARVKTLGRHYASEVLPDTVRPRAHEQIAWHKHNGDRIVVVSGHWPCTCGRGASVRVSTALPQSLKSGEAV